MSGTQAADGVAFAVKRLAELFVPMRDLDIERLEAGPDGIELSFSHALYRGGEDEQVDIEGRIGWHDFLHGSWEVWLKREEAEGRRRQEERERERNEAYRLRRDAEAQEARRRADAADMAVYLRVKATLEEGVRT